jgi:multicomponent Na+:H+ antiporter subunit D
MFSIRSRPVRISHAGIMLAGIAMIEHTSLAGVANLVASHGFLKGALFLAAGILLREFHSVDELRLHGAGRRLPLLGVLWGLAGFGLIGVPYVGTFLGHALADDGAIEHGHAWLPPLLLVASAVSSAAILRAGARVFLGWGPKRDPLLAPEPREEPPQGEGSGVLMTGVTAALVAVGLALSVVPGLQHASEHAAARFVEPPVSGLKAAHSGVVGDYVMWLAVGTALLGGIWLVTLGVGS